METEERLVEFRVQRRLAHSPQDVWTALTNPAEVMEWMNAPNASIDNRAGGHVDIEAAERITGRILAWDPPRLFEHEFILAPSRRIPAGENAVMRYVLEPDGTGCLLTVTLTRLTPATSRLFSGGLKGGLDRLEKYLGSRRRGTEDD